MLAQADSLVIERLHASGSLSPQLYPHHLYSNDIAHGSVCQTNIVVDSCLPNTGCGRNPLKASLFRVDMATFEQRLRSFTSWPHARNHAPEYMAAAGFLQNHRVQGHSDAAICFNCDMTLASWETAMDPVKEHLERSPRCTWITGKMMNTQEKREDTCGDWPFDQQLSYMMVAAARFFQSDVQTHTVTCYSCQLTLGPQQLGNDPLRAHIGLDNPRSPCAYLSRATSSTERALPPTPPPTPPRLRHRCPVCHNLFPTQDGLRRHLADPKKAHLLPTSLGGSRRQRANPKKAHLPRPRKVTGPRTAPIGMRRGVTRRAVPDLASRITRPPLKPEYIKIEDDGDSWAPFSTGL